VSPVPDTVYDRRDDDVTPAMLLRPHLPTVTPTDAARKGLSVLEAVISADGQVEQVRLVRTTPERRYYDSMLLAAVKAWVFQPASRQGQPVRYRVRIPLT
jgi:TonB family protein